jgi:hypothetical protein
MDMDMERLVSLFYKKDVCKKSTKGNKNWI